MSLTANLNRDTKKTRKAYNPIDFCFFHDVEANRPQAQAAAAYMRLVQDKVIPGWALFCFTDFKWSEPSQRTVDECAMVGENWVLLAPESIEGGYTGLLLAEFIRSGEVVQGNWMGKTITVRLPVFEDYVLAKEGVELDEMAPPVPAAVLQSD